MLHAALLVYISDMMLMAAALVPHGVALGQEGLGDKIWDGLSLDHAIWFHQPVAADEWLLFAQSSPFVADGRSLSRAEVFDLDGAPDRVYRSRRPDLRLATHRTH